MPKKTPKGRVPSLIGSTNGRPVREEVLRSSKCYRCNDEIVAGSSCIAIPQLGSGFASRRRVCNTCYQAILKQTLDDLEELREI